MDSLRDRFEKHEHDHELAEHVAEELQCDPSVAGARRVAVSAAAGIVRLEGKVDSLAQQLAMERAARRVAGVRGVINDLEIVPPKNQSRNDDQIAGAVAIVLAWTANLPDGISGSVSSGYVTLAGTVASWQQKQAAENAVRQLVGVRGVNNHLRFAVKELAQEIEVTIDSATRRRAEHDES